MALLRVQAHPAIDAFTFLEGVQGLVKTHGAFAFLTGMACFALALTPLQIAVWSTCAPLVFYVLRHVGVLLFPGQLRLLRLYSNFTGFGVITIALLSTGLLRVGLAGTLAYFGARIVLEGVTITGDYFIGRRIGAQLGEEPAIAKAGAMYFFPIKDFLRVYMIHAERMEVSLDLHASELELDPAHWAPVWLDLSTKWPQVVARYTKE